MLNNNIESIYVKGYKNFQNEFVGLEQIYSNNVIIGKNNVGKSNLLDILLLASDTEFYKENFNQNLEILIGYKLNREMINQHFSQTITTSDSYPGKNMNEFGLNYLNEIFYVKTSASYSKTFQNDFARSKNEKFENEYSGEWQILAQDIGNRLSSFKVLKVNADRDIKPELEDQEAVLFETGEGATNLIRKFVNLANYDSKLVEEEFLKALNIIMEPEAQFLSIGTQQFKKENKYYWEIYLEEKEKGRIS